MIIYSYLKGLTLGSSVTMLSYIADRTIAEKSYQEIIKKQPNLYNKGWTAIQTNMMGIGPAVYAVVDNTMIDHSLELQMDNVMYILLIHSVGYYLVHKIMHEKKEWLKYHNFHHKFDKILVPSIGNAVSSQEFFAAYMFPFIASALALHPTEISFVAAIALISLFNIIIHTKELDYLDFGPYIVTPKKHIHHHKVRKEHYAAPILDLDTILEKHAFQRKKIDN